MLKIQLSRNFTTDEFACRCCGKCNVDKLLISRLQLVRDIVGVPIHINSGYRCEAHNKAVGGSPNSQHVQGRAADIRIKGFSVEQMYKLCKNFFTGIGIYPEQNFIHVDVRDKPATWVYLKSKKKYLTLDQFQMELEKDSLLRYDYTVSRP